ncbi:MAG: hypothetical protein QW714_02255, partial [Nanopusillaceae archaeon]
IDSLTKSCYGNYSCIVNFTFGSNCELLPGNKTVIVKAFNSTAFYELTSFSFNYYFESLTTSAQIIAYNITVYNVSLTEDKVEKFNLTIKNTGKGTIHSIYITKHSGPFDIINATPIPDIPPETEINITFNITIPAGTPFGTYNQVYNASWIDNNQQKSYIIYSPIQKVTVVGNPQITLNTTNITQIIQHGSNYSISISINNTGNAPLQNVWVDYSEINLPKEWITINPNYWQSIDSGKSELFTVIISIPIGTSPGLYRGIINVTSNLGQPDERIKQIEINITVPVDSRWIMKVYSRNGTEIKEIEETYGLNEAGLLGNITIENIGNVPLNFSIDYTSLTQNNPITLEVLDLNKIIDNEIYNPTFVYVEKQSSKQIKFWQNGYYVSLDFKLNVTIRNSTANPSINFTTITWHIIDVAPYISNLSFSKYIEIKRLQQIGTSFDDDQDQLAIVYLNLTLPNSTLYSLVCAQGTRLTDGYYTCNYYPPIEGLYLANLTACDTGNKCRTISFNFTAYAKTQLKIIPIDTYVYVDGITQFVSKNISLNISITNLNDTVTAYNISVQSSPPGGTNWQVIYCNISQIAANSTRYCLLNLTIPSKTLPREYTIRPYVTWNNADGSLSQAHSDQTVTIKVLPTRILNLTYYSNSITINHNSSISLNFTIFSEGNAEIRNISFKCLRETDLCNYVSFNPDFVQNISAGEYKNITLTISLPLGFSSGNYYPIINITSIDDTKNFTIEVNVPQDYRFITDKENITLQLLAGFNYTKNVINITNVGNQILRFSLSLEGNITEIMSLAENYKELNPTQTFSVFANITAPNKLIFYEGNLNISEQATSTIKKIPIRVEIYPAEITANEIYPNYNVLENQNITLNITFRIGNEIITSDTSFEILIENNSCLINSVQTTNNYWMINCSLPKALDGRWHNITIKAFYQVYNILVEKVVENAIYYKDITLPTLISKEIPSVEYPNNVTIKLNLSDNVAIDKVLVNIQQLNQTFELSSENNVTWQITLSNLEPNDYDITFFINDTTNNTLILKDYFEVFVSKNVWLNVTNSRDEAVNLNFTFYRNNTNQILQREVVIGFKNLTIHKRIYDLLIESNEAKIKLYNLNSSELPNDFIKYDKVYPTEVNLYKPLGGIAIITPLEIDSTIRIYYDVSIAQQYGASEDNLKIIYCSDWDFYQKTCSNWIQLVSKVDKRYKFVETNTIFKSGAYVIAEGIRKEAKLDVYDPLPIDAQHWQKYTIKFVIQSSGTDPVSNVRIECLYGNVCYDFNP